jgi:hypothetical protein
MGTDTGGIPTTDNILEKTEIFGYPTDNIPDYSITCKLIGLLIEHNFDKLGLISIKLSILNNRLVGYMSVATQIFRLSRIYCRLWVSHPYPYPYPRKFRDANTYAHGIIGLHLYDKLY